MDFEKLQVINRSPAYRNQYVHRRDSSSVAKLSEDEIKQRERVGLITACSIDEGDAHDNDALFDEEWDDMDDSKENEEEDYDESSEDEGDFALSHRRSSVDPSQTRASPDGGSHDNHIWTFTSMDDLTSTSKKMDFTHVETANRRQRRELRFSMIEEVDESDEDTTLDGTEAMDH